MIAIDEPSALRMKYTPDNPPKWTDGLFTKVSTEADLLNDLQTLETSLTNDPSKINYRIFSTDVLIRGSKWSKDP